MLNRHKHGFVMDFTDLQGNKTEWELRGLTDL